MCVRVQDLDREDDLPLQQGSVGEVFSAQNAEKAETRRRDRVQRKKLRALGFEDEGEVLH